MTDASYSQIANNKKKYVYRYVCMYIYICKWTERKIKEMGQMLKTDESR